MARTTIGGWFKQTFGGAKPTGSVGTQSIGMKVTTSDGVALGTVAQLWRGADAADHAPHDDTFGVWGRGGPHCIFPTNAVARTTDQEMHLTVAMAQVTARGWRYRPEWIPQEQAGTAPTA